MVSDDVEPGVKLSPQQRAHQQEIENSVLVLAADVIRCNKNFSSETEETLLVFLNRQFGAKAKHQRINTVNNHIDTGTEPFTKIACKELKLLTTYDSRQRIVHFLFNVARADNFVNEKEMRCIQRIAGYLGISERDFKNIRQVSLSSNSPFTLLDISEDATTEEIKLAYKRMVLKYHPDKRGNQLSEQEAAAKFRDVKAAYETLMLDKK